jgi:hypothetical protein
MAALAFVRLGIVKTNRRRSDARYIAFCRCWNRTICFVVVDMVCMENIVYIVPI